MLTSVIAFALLTSKNDPTLLVLNKGQDTIWLVDMKSGNARAKLKTGPNPNEVAVSPNQKIAAISDMGTGGRPVGETLTFVDIEAGKVTNTVNIKPHGAPHGVIWLSDERLLFTSHVSDNVCEFDVPSGKIIRAMPTEQKGTHLVVVSPNKERLYAVNAGSGSVSALDFKTGKVIKQVQTGPRAEGISLSPDGKWLACGNVGGDTVSIVDTTSLEVTKTIDGVGMPIRTLFSVDGKNLAVSCVKSGTLEVFDTAKWSKVSSVGLKDKPIANPDYGNQWPTPMNLYNLKNGNMMLVLVTSHAVAEIDTKNWKVVRTFDSGPVPDGIAVSGGR